MDIDIRNTKIELIQWLTTVEDISIIKKIMELRKIEKEDWWDNLYIVEKKSVELGISDADKGNLKPQSDAKNIYEKWL